MTQGGYQVIVILLMKSKMASSVARAFPGGRLAHPEDQNEEENKLKCEEK